MVFLRFSDVVERISAYLVFECSRREFTIQGLERFPLIEIALEKKMVSHIGIFFKDSGNVHKSSCEPIGQDSRAVTGYVVDIEEVFRNRINVCRTYR